MRSFLVVPLLLLLVCLSSLTLISAVDYYGGTTTSPPTRTATPTPSGSKPTKAVVVPTTSAPTTIFNCLVNPCDAPIQSGECEFGCTAIYVNGCNYICKDPRLGETVRTISFQISYTSKVASDVETAKAIDAAMRLVAGNANIPASDYIISDSDITRVTGKTDAKTGKWQVKIGFRAFPGGDDRERFIAALKKVANPTAVQLLSAEDSPLAGLLMDENDPVSQGKKYYATQTCPDGQVINAQEQCSNVITTSAAPSSSSSTSMSTAIIGAFIGGAVVVALIAISAIIIHRRRMNVVKSMEGRTTTTTGEQHV